MLGMDKIKNIFMLYAKTSTKLKIPSYNEVHSFTILNWLYR